MRRGTSYRGTLICLALLGMFGSACQRNGDASATHDETSAGAQQATSQTSPAATEAAGSEHMVAWLQPPPPAPRKRSDEEEQRGEQEGRELPTPELLQPTLDPQLQDFEPRQDQRLEGSFLGGASDILPGLVGLWIQGFHEYYPDVQIEIATPYAGSQGMLGVIEGKYDFVFVSRELKPTDVTSFHEKYGYDPLSVPISGASYRHYGFLDAVGFFVNVDNPLEKLSFDQIDQLYSSTHLRGGQAVTTWGELGLGGGWAKEPVHLYGIAPWNGFEEFVRQRVLSVDGKRGEWRDDIQYDKEAFPIAERVANDPLGIGYTGLAYVSKGVKMLPLSGATGSDAYVPPSYEAVAAATYPLSRLIYCNVNKAPDRALDPALEEFLRYIVSKQGQQRVQEQAIYLPLRQWQVEKSLALLGKS
jgi:ABC-type phosphate transport system substrate-binding protein